MKVSYLSLLLLSIPTIICPIKQKPKPLLKEILTKEGYNEPDHHSAIFYILSSYIAIKRCPYGTPIYINDIAYYKVKNEADASTKWVTYKK